MKEELTKEAKTDLLTIVGLIDRELGEPPISRPEGFGITIREYMQAKNCSDGVARNFLNAMVERGKFEKKVMIDGHGNCPMVYYPKENATE